MYEREGICVENDRARVKRLKKIVGNDLHAQFKDEHLTVLDLSGLALTAVPVELCQFSHLQALYLSDNQLSALPPELGQLSMLEELFLFENQLTTLPAELAQLLKLQELYLHKNRLTHLPAALGQLLELRKLSLYENQLSQLPPELGQLTKLESLYLNTNLLTDLPKELGQLTNLQELYVNNNCLAQIPPQLGQLAKLQKLSAYNNELSLLPAALGQLGTLQKLYLSDNPLLFLPVELGQLKHLQELSVTNCPLLTPPPEIVTQGTRAILSFLQELSLYHIVRYEAKLLVVGEGGTGKSSLLRALHGENFDPSLNSTHGVNVDSLQLPHPVLSSQTILLNTWDFGGQQIYHSTHQFFLTKRSLYLVVWNARLGADQGKLNYWLNTIQSLAPDAPVLLIATHVDERPPDLNYHLYHDAYPQLVGAMSVSNKEGTGIQELKSHLARCSVDLPLVGQPWPGNWIEAEHLLMQCEEHHIDAQQYLAICSEGRVEAEIAQGPLGSYLHDLGKILYFRDDYVLSNLVVLKPNWVTKAISRLLEDDGVRTAHGILTHAELPRIWATDEDGRSYGPYLYPIFLRLMERFDLSYQIEPGVPGEYPTHSLVPQLLPYQPPVQLPRWPVQPKQGQMQLQMVHHFDFVPSGIMSRFIVRTHRYTLNKHWREGVLLAYRGHFARVELNPMLRELRLLVWGIQPHNFFTILKDTLEFILERFAGLHVHREVPCICHWQSSTTLPCPRSYSYNDLVRRMELGKSFIECPESFVDVSVHTLLYGIHISTAPQIHASIEKSKHAILAQIMVLQQNDERLYQRMQETNQLIEWSVRNFTRLWNLQMRWLEAECPNTFVLLPSSKSLFKPKDWIGQEYTLHLLCQYPSGPHRVLLVPGYSLRRARSWWIKLSPWLKHLVTFLKYGVPFVGMARPVIDILNTGNMDAELDLLKQISDDLPDLVDGDGVELDHQHFHVGEDQAVGAALRTLYSFLKEVDPSQHWSGLQKVITPDGNVLWLCKEHSQPYEVRPLQLED